MAIAAVCAAAGWATTRQSTLPALYLAVCAGLAWLVIFGELRVSGLLAWAPLAVLLYPLGRNPASVLTFDRVWIGGLVVLLLVLPRARAVSPAARNMLLALGLFTAAFGLRAVLTAGGQINALGIWVDAVLLPVILFAVVRRAAAVDTQFPLRFSRTLVIAGALLACMGIAERAFGFELASLSGGAARFDTALGFVRVSGPYPVPEVFALSLVVCFAATLYWIQVRGRAVYFVGWMLAVAQLLAIGLTYFRVAWIAAVVVLVVGLGFRPQRYLRAVAVLAAFGLVIALLFTQLQRVPSISARVTNTRNIDTRLVTYRQGFQVFDKAPVFGVGVDQYSKVAKGLPRLTYAGAEPVPFPHSSFEGILAEQGAVGFGALVLVVLAVWRLLRAFLKRARSRADALLGSAAVGAAIAYVLFGLTLTMLPYGPSNALFLVLLGVVAGSLDRMAGENAEPQHAKVPA